MTAFEQPLFLLSFDQLNFLPRGLVKIWRVVKILEKICDNFLSVTLLLSLHLTIRKRESLTLVVLDLLFSIFEREVFKDSGNFFVRWVLTPLDPGEERDWLRGSP